MPFSPFSSTKPAEQLAAEMLEVINRFKHSDATTVPPLILVPGLLGSGLEAKIDSGASLPTDCKRYKYFQRLWVEPAHFFPIECFEEEMKLSFDPSTETFSNTPGVHTQAIDFGGVDGVSYLAWNFLGMPYQNTSYLQPLIDYLQTTGYTVGQNLAAAPYDWRLVSNPNGWNNQIKGLIESLYAKNGNTPVYVLCHSMGNLEFYSFLLTMDSAWISQYVGGFISAAGPWSGASFALRTIISGLQLNIGPVVIPPEVVQTLVQSWGSISWMLPQSNIHPNAPLVTVDGTTSYTAEQLGQLFTDIGATTTNEIYNSLADNWIHGSLKNLGVNTYCLYGEGNPTPIAFDYANGLNAQPTCVTCGDGDGVVPISSLLKCAQMSPLHSKAFQLLGHMDLVKDPVFFGYLTEILTGAI